MAQIPLHRYRLGMRKLVDALGKDHARISEVQILQHRLTNNLARVLEHGSTPALEAERRRILESCDRLSRQLCQQSFYAFCGVDAPTPPFLAEDDAHKQGLLERYFDQMRDLLENRALRTAKVTSEKRNFARAQTLEILHDLAEDGVRKGQVLQFLYESGLITEGPGVLFLSEADLSAVHLSAATLVEAHLAGASLESACLDNAHLEWSRLGEAQLREAHLRRAYLVAAHLSGADLSGAALTEACLIGANLSGANLSGADLRRAHIEWAFMVTSNLRGADLGHARLIGAELKSANLADANLVGADLRETRLTWTRLRGAIYDDTTRWPVGFDPIGAGAVHAQIPDAR